MYVIAVVSTSNAEDGKILTQVTLITHILEIYAEIVTRCEFNDNFEIVNVM